jgi:hypothetical protein
LKAFENELTQFLNTKSGKKIKDRIDKLNKDAETIDISQCPEKLTQALAKTTQTFNARQERIKKLTGLYKDIQSDFDENIKEAENLDQVYEKIAYLVDLSKGYVEHATDAATKGAFCTVLAENIMKKVFIPDVRGIEINKAEARVKQKGLNVTRSEIGYSPSEAKSGMVENIIPGITKRVQKGTNVTLSYYDERPDRNSQLANYDCRQWPGSQPVWDTQNDRPACGCTGEMVWNQDNSKCISRIDAALANANCGYPNSYPVWNQSQNRVVCDCIPGTVWNNDNSACIDSRQAALNNYNCSQYPGTIPNYDNNGNLGCACPGGTQWIQNMNRCVDQQEIALANADCSHKPGSVPRWNYMTNQVDCECELPYSQDPMTGKCVDFMAQLEQDNREFNQEMERDRQAFDKEMADRRRRDQEQNQQFFNNMMDIWDGFSPPNGPGNSTSQHNPPVRVENAYQNDFVGHYVATDPARSYQQYHAAISLENNGTGRAKEWADGKVIKPHYTETMDARGFIPLTWSYQGQIFTVDYTCKGRLKGLGRFSGQVKGDTNNFVLNGHWAGGLSGKIVFKRR